jgi:hypothetical protein
MIPTDNTKTIKKRLEIRTDIDPTSLSIKALVGFNLLVGFNMLVG